MVVPVAIIAAPCVAAGVTWPAVAVVVVVVVVGVEGVAEVRVIVDVVAACTVTTILLFTLVLPLLYAWGWWVLEWLERGRRHLVTIPDALVPGEAPSLWFTHGHVRVMVVGRHLGEVVYLPNVDDHPVLDSAVPPLRRGVDLHRGRRSIQDSGGED